MKNNNRRIGDFPKKGRLISIIILSIVYLVMSFFLGALSKGKESILILDISVGTFVIRGVLTQIQMLILVFLVLKENKKGYIISVILNLYSIIVAFMFLFINKSPDSLPGVISYVGVLIIITLIINYKRRIQESIVELTEHKAKLEESEKELFNMAFYDKLTKLPNRYLFHEFLEKEIQFSIRNESQLCVLFVDLDSFKTVNDTMGHKIGDEVLIQVAHRLRASIRVEDLLSRFGGDEFLISVGNIKNKEEFISITKKIQSVFKDPIIVEGDEFYTSASIGVAVYPQDGEDPGILIKNADMAMNIAKSKGKNQSSFCTMHMKDDSMRKLKLTNCLYRALDNNEFFLHYQPQIATVSQEIVGYEALLRWENEEFGSVSPAEFIPLAEQTGLIKSIGLWVLKTVCEEYKIFSENKKLRVSINLSIEQLKDLNIATKIRDILENTQMNPQYVKFEITESAAFSKEFDVFGRLNDLKALGVKISVDDFGKEYSSLNRIRMFQFDQIKIDMDFVHGISTGNDKDRAIVKTIIHLAQNLGVNVIAEGVETEEQYQFLKLENCDEIQGFYFYKSMLASEIRKLNE